MSDSEKLARVLTLALEHRIIARVHHPQVLRHVEEGAAEAEQLLRGLGASPVIAPRDWEIVRGLYRIGARGAADALSGLFIP